VFTVCGETNSLSAIPGFGRSSEWTRRRIPSSRSRVVIAVSAGQA
jgi:hypothetical protein